MAVRCFVKDTLNDGARIKLFSVAVPLLLLLSGCGGSDFPKTEPVSGSVTLNGEPIADAEVYFVSEKLVTKGRTDSKGHYALVNGAVAGENKVYFSKIEGGEFEEGDGMDELQMAEAAASGGGGSKANGVKQIIPPEYSDASAPQLNFLVPSGGSTSADFKL